MPSPASPAALPDGIEIFRAGRHVSDAGDSLTFSDADVRAIAAGYDPAKREAPLTIGHPEHDLPAYGYVSSLSVNGAGRLAMDTHQVPPQFAEMVRAGSFKKRSASFYPPQHPSNPTPGRWYLRHVAFLGAQPPAIAGLADIRFSEGDATGAVNFSEPTTTQEHDDMDEELKKQLEAAQAEAAEAKQRAATAEGERDAARGQVTQFAEQQRADRRATFVSFAEAQVVAGRLLPKNKAMAVEALVVLGDAQPVSFSEGDATRQVAPAQWLQELISGTAPVVNFGEHATGGGGAAGTAGKTEAEIDQAAKQYAAKHAVSYAEALSKVCTFTA